MLEKNDQNSRTTYYRDILVLGGSIKNLSIDHHFTTQSWWSFCV